MDTPKIYEIDGKWLTDFMARHLPIARELGIRVVGFDAQSLTLEAPLQPNINDKGTAFGGSIYCVAVMSCWGMVYLQGKAHGLENPNIVVSHGEIDYLRPVSGAIRAVCHVDDGHVFEHFWQDYNIRQKAKVGLSSQVLGAEGETLASFKGRYAIIG